MFKYNGTNSSTLKKTNSARPIVQLIIFSLWKIHNIKRWSRACLTC
jgi:hypothetical protein